MKCYYVEIKVEPRTNGDSTMCADVLYIHNIWMYYASQSSVNTLSLHTYCPLICDVKRCEFVHWPCLCALREDRCSVMYYLDSLEVSFTFPTTTTTLSLYNGLHWLQNFHSPFLSFLFFHHSHLWYSAGMHVYFKFIIVQDCPLVSIVDHLKISV